MKRLLKAGVQSAVSQVAPLLWRLDRQPRLLVLMYHRVLPQHHPARAVEQPGMYVSPETFAMHVRLLQAHFTLVHLDDWLDARRAGRPLPVRACAITFDDGWRDNYEYAFPVLRAAAAPATIFLVSDMVGTRYRFWPNRLADLLANHAPAALATRLPEWLEPLVAAAAVDRGAPLDAEQIDAVIGRCKQVRTDAQIAAALDDIERALGGGDQGHRDLADWDEIREMVDSGLVRVGSHTRRHTRLVAGLTVEQLQDEIAGSHRVLEERLGHPPRTFCYPNGDHCPAAVEAVRARYIGAVTTSSGWNASGADAHLLRRVGVHEDVTRTPAAFLARLAGIG